MRALVKRSVTSLEVHLKCEESVPRLSDHSDTFVAFLFDADHQLFAKSKIYNYGTPCEEAFLEALAASDEEHECAARIRRGDVLALTISLRN